MTRRDAVFVAAALLAGCRRKTKAPAPLSSVPPGWSETGVASWYGHPYHGRRAANGEIYDMEQMTAAHRTLPFGTMVRVTSLSNGKEVTVRITDRGPFVEGRVIDLSRAAARDLDLIAPGLMKVRLDAVALPAGNVSSRFAVQVGSFSDRQRAERLCQELQRDYAPVHLVERQSDRTRWRVLVGDKPDETQARVLAGRLKESYPEAFIVRLDD